MIIGPLTFGQILRIILRRKITVVIGTVLIAGLAAVIGQILPLHYASEGSLILENALTTEPTGTSTVFDGVSTQADVLQSEGVLRRVVAELDLVHNTNLVPSLRLPPAEMAVLNRMSDYLTRLRQFFTSQAKSSNTTDTDSIVRYLQKHLSVESKKNSSVISLSFQAGGPIVAAAVVNAIMAIYLDSVHAGQDAQIARISAWTAQRIATNARAVEAAEQRVTDFVHQHPHVEVQGSSTAAIQFSTDLAQLALARENLAHRQAALDTVTSGGSISGARETLESKTIQSLKDSATRVTEQINALAPTDPRRTAIQAELVGLHNQIDQETQLILTSLTRDVEIARAKVQALESAVRNESAVAQKSSIDSAALKQLAGELDTQRQQYLGFITQAEQLRIGAMQSASASVLSQALPPRRPVTHAGALALALGLLGGISTMAGIVVLREVLSRRISSIGHVMHATGLPTLGSLPEVARRSGDVLAAFLATASIQEMLRSIGLCMRSQTTDGTTIIVTSSDVGEGKTTVVAALARRIADDGYRVLLIDSDLRRPRLAFALNLRPEAYLEWLLEGRVTLEQTIVATAGLDCLLARGNAGNPTKILASTAFAELLSISREKYDYVILDSPPVLHVPDPILLANLCQHIIFIVEADRALVELVTEATKRFDERDRDKILTLLTRVPVNHLDRRDTYSGYAPVPRPNKP